MDIQGFRAGAPIGPEARGAEWPDEKMPIRIDMLANASAASRPASLCCPRHVCRHTCAATRFRSWKTLQICSAHFLASALLPTCDQSDKFMPNLQMNSHKNLMDFVITYQYDN
jgi:hypothetical protein